ncbi:conserved hypothetical protein [Gluconacetobacter diazotrophicus PA1 5]|uniref:Uncharacterized protein n=2 Tax=Gluconacetobacter diazotrophicus TaxID=33996 RepID=A9HNJ1_GLUDA|nr:hypothetical protein [Gluconacetobacter diazotrophicus]ACI50542.1 conserved hypothetical protein [Gluconacetobacter diazotrophicus PA1 5]MBB2155735.1 hypothetical protein [Gluconacetobacter diazotrophicus]TWB09374.1 hypothetical protein FBZ86_10436 [Gluconacetobacter diazotrophicus]CAP56451.1 hypothetical protein GDI2508 [Gluconacetobacter diazotrophicus PA1 5]
MLYEFKLTSLIPQMSGATTECVYAAPDAALRMGSKLMDLSVDLSSAFAQECPPVSYYRVVLREAVFLRRIDLSPGQYCALGDRLALFSTDPDESLDQEVDRPVRCTVAGIIHHDGMWTGRHS